MKPRQSFSFQGNPEFVLDLLSGMKLSGQKTAWKEVLFRQAKGSLYFVRKILDKSGTIL